MSKSQPNETKGVKTLLGDPKKAIVKLAIPMIVAMVIQSLYNLVDAFWVAGLGADALAATGFIFPFFMMIMAIATGIGIGAGSAISRRIGAKDKEGADNVAIHSIILLVLLSLVITIPLFLFIGDIVSTIGGGQTTGMAMAYGKVIFAGCIFIFFTNIANAILRAEGDVKRAMYAMMLGSVLNIILDPFFIYKFNIAGFEIGFDLGIAGAAWATILSIAVTAILMANWLFLKKNTFVSFNFKDFKFAKDILKDIFSVGLPASISQLSMSITMILINVILVNVSLGSTDGVAVYTTGWRIASIAVMPLMGVATAVVSVGGAAYGAKDYKKLSISHLYATKLGFMSEALITIVIFIFAVQISAVFTQAEATQRIADDLTTFLRIACIFFPFVAFGMLSSSVFQAVGKGFSALMATVLRSSILTPLFSVIFAYGFSMGLEGVWWGIVVANIIGSQIVFFWVRYSISKLRKKASAE